jgi:hypothetical protein
VDGHARSRVARGDTAHDAGGHGHGTGWPFGGPWVDDEIAARSLAYKTWTLGSGERLTEPVTLRQAPLVRATGNQIHIVNEGAPGDPPRGANPSALAVRPDARPIQISDLVEPVTANRNLQALALEQVKYPRDLPVIALIAFSDAGASVDLTSRVQPDGTLDWTAPQGRWTVYGLFAGGTASSSSERLRAAKGW